jgi:Fe-S-cluster containining protein
VNRDLAEAFVALERLYSRIDSEAASLGECAACGKCCHFNTHGHRLYSTRLEALYLVSKNGLPPKPFDDDNCGYQSGALCAAREGRVLGCRTFFCKGDSAALNALNESALNELKNITTQAGLDWSYAPLSDHLSRM